MNFPDHNTINRFRGVRLQNALRQVFVAVVKLLAEEGLLSLEEVFTDGTKMEANANRYTFVWKKSALYHKEKMGKQLNELWNYAQQIASEEDRLPDPPDFTDINKEKVETTVAQLNKVLGTSKEVD